jgi:acetyl-CoA carboxylase carboxyl transferase subunit alpha
MKIMSTDLKDLGIVDEIIPEPDGGAHSDYEGAAKLFGDTLERQLLILSNQGIKELLHARYQKFRHMCQFFDLGT